MFCFPKFIFWDANKRIRTDIPWMAPRDSTIKLCSHMIAIAQHSAFSRAVLQPFLGFTVPGNYNQGCQTGIEPAKACATDMRQSIRLQTPYWEYISYRAIMRQILSTFPKRPRGFEPLLRAWKAPVLPLHHGRIWLTKLSKNLPFCHCKMRSKGHSKEIIKLLPL